MAPREKPQTIRNLEAELKRLDLQVKKVRRAIEKLPPWYFKAGGPSWHFKAGGPTKKRK